MGPKFLGEPFYEGARAGKFGIYRLEVLEGVKARLVQHVGDLVGAEAPQFGLPLPLREQVLTGED